MIETQGARKLMVRVTGKRQHDPAQLGLSHDPAQLGLSHDPRGQGCCHWDGEVVKGQRQGFRSCGGQ